MAPPNLLSFQIGNGWQNPEYVGMGSWGRRGTTQNFPAPFQPMFSDSGGHGSLPGVPGAPAGPAGPSPAQSNSILGNAQRAVAKSNNGGLGGPAVGTVAAAAGGGVPGGAPTGVGAAAVGQGGFQMPNYGSQQGYNGMLDAQNFANNLGLANTIIGGVQSVGSIGLGIWQMMQAQEMQGIAKTSYQENYNASAQAYNTRMRDQYIAARGDTEQTRAEMAARDIKPSTIK